MPITLAESKLLTQDKLAQLVVDEFRKDTLLEKMIFDNTANAGGGQSLAYVYNRVTTLPKADFRAINAEYTPQETKTTQYTANLKPFGGSYEVDRVIQNHVKGITDQITFQQQQKIQATKAQFANAFINGDSAVDAKSFDGLEKAVTGSSTERVPAAAIDLSGATAIDGNYKKFMDELDLFLSELDGTPTLLYMNRKLRAIFSGIARRSATFKEDKDEFGMPLLTYSGIPLVAAGDKPGTATPIVPIVATGDDAGTTSLFAMRIGMDGVHAISPEGDQIVKAYLPDMTASGAVKKGEVEMVAAMALKSTKAAGVFRKVKVS